MHGGQDGRAAAAAEPIALGSVRSSQASCKGLGGRVTLVDLAEAPAEIHLIHPGGKGPTAHRGLAFSATREWDWHFSLSRRTRPIMPPADSTNTICSGSMRHSCTGGPHQPPAQPTASPPRSREATHLAELLLDMLKSARGLHLQSVLDGRLPVQTLQLQLYGGGTWQRQGQTQTSAAGMIRARHSAGASSLTFRGQRNGQRGEGVKGHGGVTAFAAAQL